MKFLLDMDGVCTNFVKGVAALFPNTLIDLRKPRLDEMFGTTNEEIWGKIDSRENFWRDLEPYPWFEEMYNFLCSKGEVIFCTSPSLDPNCSKGKVQWLQDRFGKDFREYVLTNKKYLLAKQDTVLIDDMDYQCRSFIAEGGHSNARALLFPQPWNGFNIEDKAGFIKFTVETLEQNHLISRHS